MYIYIIIVYLHKIILITAFSWFALCEYVIAFANMVFHVTVIKDFPMEQLIVTQWDNSLDKEKNCKEQINHNSVKANIGKLN